MSSFKRLPFEECESVFKIRRGRETYIIRVVLKTPVSKDIITQIREAPTSTTTVSSLLPNLLVFY